MEELKPCPFCGNQPEISFDGDENWTIECKHHWWKKTDIDGIRIAGDICIYSEVIYEMDVESGKYVLTEENKEKARLKAIEVWNTRAYEDKNNAN